MNGALIEYIWIVVVRGWRLFWAEYSRFVRHDENTFTGPYLTITRLHYTVGDSILQWVCVVMFLQTRFDRHFDYTGDIPIPVCFHNRKPSYYVHTKQCIQEFDLFTGGLLASIPSGVPSDRNVAQMCASFSKKGQEYVVACQDNANMTVYDMTRRHFVATTTDGYASSTMTVFAATHGGIDPSAFGCGYNDHAISVSFQSSC